MPRWTDSDNLHSRDALVVGGPNDGLRIGVSDTIKGFRYPDVIDLENYKFDHDRWEFIYIDPFDQAYEDGYALGRGRIIG